MTDREVTMAAERLLHNRGLSMHLFCERYGLDVRNVWRLMHGRGRYSPRHPLWKGLVRALAKEGLDPDVAMARELATGNNHTARRGQAARVRLGITYTQLGHATGIPRATVHTLLSGSRIGLDRVGSAKRLGDRRRRIELFMKARGATAKEIETFWWPVHQVPSPGLRRIPAELRHFLKGGPHMLSEQTLTWFGLKADPFGEFASAEEPIFLGRNQRRALSQLKRAIRLRYLVGLVGPVGSGKTQLWRHLREELRHDDRYQFVFLRDPTQERLTPTQMIDSLLHVVVGRGVQGRARRVRELGEGLKAQADQGRIVTLVVDEGQLLADTLLRTLKGLAELEDGYLKMLGIVVLAQAQFHDSLRSTRVEEVRRRLRVIDYPGIHHMEIGAYLKKRLSAKGAKRMVFDQAALKVFARKQYRAVTCMPLGLGNVASRAMEIANRRNHKTVKAEDAEEALRQGDSA